jgi:hypothetical protein
MRPRAGERVTYSVLLQKVPGRSGFRSRVRSLLGLSHSDGVEMNFSNPLPIPGFTYVAPRFTGEFELPDELFTGGTRHVTRAEEITPSVGRSAGTPEQNEPYRRAARRPEELNQIPTTKPPVDRVEFQAARQPYGVPRPTPVGEISVGEPSLPQSRPKSTQKLDVLAGSPFQVLMSWLRILRPVHVLRKRLLPARQD